MSSQIIYHGDIALGTHSKAAFTFGDKKSNPTTIKLEDNSSGEIAIWGDDNRYPQEHLAALRKNGAAGSALRLLKATHYGQGFHLFTEDSNEEGKREKNIKSIKDYPDIFNFFRQNKMYRFWTETISDLETFYLGQPEFIIDQGFNKIVSCRRQQTAKIRFEKMNERTGLIENAYLCHNWKRNTTPDDEYVAKIPVIDSYWNADQIKEYCKSKKIYKFIMPIFYPMMDETYYPDPDIHAVHKNGWLEVANSIPEYKKNLFEQQLNLNFIVNISEEYFTRTYGSDWEDFKPDKKQEIRKALATAIDDHLSGNKNAGKSIQSVTYKDTNGNWVKGIEVDQITKGQINGEYLPDASAANSEILFNYQVDPSLIGAGIPGGKMNTGSGSDKREAFSILTSLFKTKRETTLDIWRLLRDFNGWPAELEGDFANTVLTTLDANPTGVQNGI